MPYEYLVVLYPSQRRVKLNDEVMGQTNAVIEIEGGEYDVSLGPPTNFAPGVQKIDLRNTSLFRPLTLSFAPAETEPGGES